MLFAPASLCYNAPVHFLWGYNAVLPKAAGRAQKLMKKNVLFAAAAVVWSLTAVFPAMAFPQNAAMAPSAAQSAIAVEITTGNGTGNSLQKENGWQAAALKVTDETGVIAAEDGSGQVKVRGNSTAAGEKKPYNIRFSEKTDLFGFGKAKTYCLLANCFDPTLMRNTLALGLAQKMGLPCTTEYRVAEVTMDGVYKGCYLLTEKVEAGKDRVDVDAGKGEFLIECERERVEDGVTYVTAGGEFRFSLTEPEVPTAEQLSAIQAVLDEALAAAKSNDTAEIEKYFDMDSFAKFYLLNEYFKGLDFAYSSTNFFYKDGKLYAGPIWDYDLSSGNVSQELYPGYYGGGTGISYANAGCAHCWFQYLLKSHEFCRKVQETFRQYQSDMRGIFEAGGRIDTEAVSFREAFRKNYAPIEEGGAGWEAGKRYSELQRAPEKTMEENISVMKEWFNNRLGWLTSVIENGKLADEADKCLWVH